APVRVNGFVCKNPMEVNADDFFKAAALDKPRVTNKVGSNVTLINVMQIAGLNTLGISIARIDYAPLGQNPPHTHPRATEILTVLEGTLYVGFVTSNQPAPQTETSSSRRCSTKVMCSSSPWGSSTSNSTPTPTSPPLQLPRSAARTQGLSQLPMRCLGQTHKYPMMFLPRRFRWKRIQ
uniref:Cupin type-1 domain-containing protein n=1 Tax=Aegilops tauschii subsp. strangulata TaxID=200361 RepID=A0A453JBI9_AEGTS